MSRDWAWEPIVAGAELVVKYVHMLYRTPENHRFLVLNVLDAWIGLRVGSGGHGGAQQVAPLAVYVLARTLGADCPPMFRRSTRRPHARAGSSRHGARCFQGVSQSW